MDSSSKTSSGDTLETQPAVHHEVAPPPAETEAEFIPPFVKKSSKYHYLWLVLIIGLVISVVGVGAYIIDAESKATPSQVAALLTPTPAVSHTEASVPSTQVNSEIYTDADLHYSFRYPKTISIVKDTSKTIKLTDAGGTDIIKMDVTSEQENFINPDDFTACSVVLNDAYTGKTNTCVTIDNNKLNFGTNVATHFVYIEVGSSGGGYDIYQTTDPAVQFTVTFASGKEDGEKVFRRLLPTFTFVASSSAADSGN